MSDFSRRTKQVESQAFERLAEWSQDELHLMRSVRYYEPTYKNPSELRRDVREILAAYGEAMSRG